MRTAMQEWFEWLKAYEYELPLELQIKAKELLDLELKYTEKDMRKCWNKAIESIKGTSLPEFDNVNDYINSLNK